MTIKASAYDVSVCRGLADKPLQLLKAHSELLKSVVDGKVMTLEQSPEASKIPGFTHPIVTNDVSFGREPVVIVNLRDYTSFDMNSRSTRIKSIADYRLQLDRGLLQSIWLTDSGRHQIQDLSPIPGNTFATYISDAVTRRLGLDPRDQFKIRMLACLWWFSQFTDDEQIDDMAAKRLVSRITRMAYARDHDVEDMLSAVPNYITGADHFCAMAQQYVGGVRLQSLNPAILYTIVRNGWFGVTGPEICAVGLEHPPTWVALCYHSLNDRSFEKTGIGRVNERLRPNDRQLFIRSYEMNVRRNERGF